MDTSSRDDSESEAASESSDESSEESEESSEESSSEEEEEVKERVKPTKGNKSKHSKVGGLKTKKDDRSKGGAADKKKSGGGDKSKAKKTKIKVELAPMPLKKSAVVNQRQNQKKTKVAKPPTPFSNAMGLIKANRSAVAKLSGIHKKIKGFKNISKPKFYSKVENDVKSIVGKKGLDAGLTYAWLALLRARRIPKK